MKNMFKILIGLYCMSAAVSFAANMKTLAVDVKFDTFPNDPKDEPIHIAHKGRLAAALNKRSIVGTETRLIDDMPVTVVLLVKPIKMNNEAVTLQFDQIHYGFNNSPTIDTQMQIALKKNQTGEMRMGPNQLKVRANWS